MAPEKSQRPRKSAAEFFEEFLKDGRKQGLTFISVIKLRQFAKLDP
jgi:hypothetical protein